MPDEPESTGPESSKMVNSGPKTTEVDGPLRKAPAPRPSAPERPGRMHRLSRSRSGIAIIGALVGALLGTGVMAWRSNELPLVARDVCWGSLSSDVVHALFSDTDVRSRELPLRRATEDHMQTECSMQAFGADELESEVIASVRTLGELRGAQAWSWIEEYLSSRMTPLGEGITGMASSTRAWVALPASCEEWPYESGEEPPLRVVTLASDAADPEGQNEVDARRGLDAMSRAVVRLANGVMERYGCDGPYSDPPTLRRAPEGDELPDVDADRLCGIQGVRLPGWAEGPEAEVVGTTPGTKPGASSADRIWACDVRQPFGPSRLRLMTVADPELAGVVSQVLGNRATRLGGDGQGAYAGGLSVYVADCRSGWVAFVAYEPGEEGESHNDRSLALAVLPSYVKAEAKRVGCGEMNVKVPTPHQRPETQAVSGQ
ncbi:MULTISPECIES: hypothetical protein [Streptomyces]|uniref:hypothetical protein n=1 Tax=Streptomyces TaxID=1883 RepID=UPI0018ACD45C|nr:hypothetical protein [Streptomyces sp. BRB081]MBL3806132.1 hypothetical protein [Streptomyces sp. BRB081]